MILDFRISTKGGFMSKAGIKGKVGLMIVLCSLILSMTSVLNAQQRRLTFILDASGSMWGQIDGKAKIKIAKDVMEELINGLSDDLQVGLVAYGHRHKGDCKDVEELMKASKLDKDRLVKKIRALQPKGKTPMVLSVEQTVAQMKDQNGLAVVVLVSDGKETCNDDPCGTMTELKKKHPNFTLFVIGFDVTEEEKKQLDCMARAGGGHYYAAQNADEFKIAAAQAVMVSQNFGEIEILPTKKDKPFKALVVVYNSSDNRRIVSGYSSDLRPFVGKVPPGNYTIVVQDLSVPEKPSLQIKGVQVKTGETTRRSTEFAQEGELQLQAFKNGQAIKALYKIFKSGEKRVLYSRYTDKNDLTRQKLLAGTYDIYFQDLSVLNKPERWARGLVVTAGKTAHAKVEFALEGTLEIKLAQHGKPQRVFYILSEAEGGNNRLTEGYTAVNKAKIHKILPGQYLVRFILKKTHKTEKEIRIKILSGQTATAVCEF